MGGRGRKKNRAADGKNLPVAPPREDQNCFTEPRVVEDQNRFPPQKSKIDDQNWRALCGLRLVAKIDGRVYVLHGDHCYMKPALPSDSQQLLRGFGPKG
ncbi:unnamed protein product [Linum tenue]|uniref:Uncharacterized protein n=1 Tax=Linum tenue TaxID=586396 RepID=A0AAV0LQ90_9ROSI|nr:unnamed protein product [Linum tenue]